MAELLTIDIHTHILPEDIPDFGARYGYRGFIHLDHHKPGCARMMMDDKFFREVQANCWDPEERLRESDHFRVTYRCSARYRSCSATGQSPLTRWTCRCS
jgi:aminocarboxymuconate-semialdehyde decarboxylase